MPSVFTGTGGSNPVCSTGESCPGGERCIQRRPLGPQDLSQRRTEDDGGPCLWDEQQLAGGPAALHVGMGLSRVRQPILAPDLELERPFRDPVE